MLLEQRPGDPAAAHLRDRAQAVVYAIRHDLA